jgi:dephospho-CoA kinase
MGSGKSLAASYITTGYNSLKMSLSGKMREIAAELEIEPTRDFLQGIGKFMRKFNDDVWVHYIYKKVQSTESAIVIDDIRRKNEIDYLKPLGFIFIKIEADSEIRKARIEKRNGKKIPDSVWTQWSEHLTENQVSELSVDYVIQNNKSKEELFSRLTEIVDKILEESN